jgi:hypothetical protein
MEKPMRYITISMLALLAATAFGQVSVTGTVPANGSTSVSVNALLSITFSAPIDTTKPFTPDGEFLTNVDSVSAVWWSADRRTFYGAAVLKPNSAYFIVVISAYPAAGGSLTLPYATHWSTGSTFPSNLYTVSGSVLSGATGVSPANAVVAISESSVMGNGKPKFLAGDVANGSGDFSIPYVPGVLGYPLAAKDANGDGQIDPSKGDVIAQGNPITPTGNVSGLALTFMSFQPLTWIPARDSALAFAARSLPGNRELRQAFCWEMDTTGKTTDWEFVYTIPGNPAPSVVRASSTGTGFDSNPGNFSEIYHSKPMPSMLTAALGDSVLARAERGGGKAFRQQKPADNSIVNRISLYLGDLHWSNFWQLVTDTSKFYWGVEYRYDVQVRPDSSYMYGNKMFLFDWSTGNLLGATGVGAKSEIGVPGKFSLEQNFPNPFNPSTTIRFSLTQKSAVSLTVHNLLGQLVGSLVRGEKEAGYHEVQFDASSLPSGVYFYRLVAGNFVQTRKLMLVR